MIRINNFFPQGKNDISFGNNIVQIMIAIETALKFGYSNVCFDDCYLFSTNNIHISNSSQKTDITGTFYNNNQIILGKKPISLGYIDHYNYINTCRKYITNILNLNKTHFSKINMEKINETLFIHIRSGDIFSTDIHPAYVQPPYSFYKYIIDNNTFSQVVIVTADLQNPCTKKLLDNYPDIILLHSDNQLDDVSILMQARHFVCGFGTFGYTIAFLNNNLQNIYIPDYCCRFFDQSITQFKVNKLTLNNYIKIGEWKASEEQLKIMLNYSMSNIST